MQLIATQGEDRYLIWEGDDEPELDDPYAVGVLVHDRGRGNAWDVTLAAAFARGYWEEPEEQPSEAELQALVEKYPRTTHSSVVMMQKALSEPQEGISEPQEGAEGP